MKAEKSEKTAEAKLEASTAWFMRFKERNCLYNTEVRGEAAGVDVEATAGW